MKSNFLNLKGISILSKQQQKLFIGGSFDLVESIICGCDCAGNVTGPTMCSSVINCPQVYTCDEVI